MVYANTSDLSILHGKNNLGMYQFNSYVAEHYFCKTCGIYTFHKTRMLPGKYGINSGCLDGIDPLSLQVKMIHGSTR